MPSVSKSDFINSAIRTDDWKDALSDLISYLDCTSEDQWCVDVVRTKDNKNCLFGHVVEFFSLNASKYRNKDIFKLANRGSEESGSDDFGYHCAFNWFDEAVASTFFVYSVNDGKNLSYPQSTPKARCIALVKDILSGNELSTYEGMDYQMAIFNSKKALNPTLNVLV